MTVQCHRDRPACKLGMVPDVFLKKRLQLINCRANTAVDFLKRLHDGTPIFERYRHGQVAIHIHSEGICARWRRNNFGLLDLLLNLDQPAMPVPVGEALEVVDPVPSVVRLESLNACGIFARDAFQETIFAPPTPEDIWLAVNRKLHMMADALRVLFGKNTRQVIQCIAQAASAFTNTNPDISRNDVERFVLSPPTIVGNKIGLGVANPLSEPIQMFACPFQYESDFLELIQHAASLGISV